MDDVADSIDMELVKYINAGYINVGTRQAVFFSFLKAIDTLPALEIDVERHVRDAILEGYEQSKTAARERAIQTQLTEKVERMDDIVAKIEKHFEPLSDDMLLVNMYDEVELRKDFDDVGLISTIRVRACNDGLTSRLVCS